MSTSTPAPKGTAHKRRMGKPKANTRGAQTTEERVVLEKELEELPRLVQEKFQTWSKGARPYQLQGMRAPILQQDMIMHAATGAGKTGIAAGPFLLESSKGKVTLMISPLLALHEEHVQTFKDEFGLEAVAINSENGGCSRSLMTDVVAGKYQIVMLSPEMLLSRRFIDGVLRKPEFGSRCLSVFVDEAHCVSHWGDMFRKKYASIGIIRGFLPKGTSFIAVSATLTPRVRRDIVNKLQMDPRTYIYVNVGNDRPNVSQVVRAMQHPMNTYQDADFLIPSGVMPSEIKKAFVYSDDVQDGTRMTDYLNSRVDERYRHLGIVRPYNAVMSRKYRKATMKLFAAGVVRVLVCTDAAGMGCNIHDIDVVLQWKAPKNLSSWVQRAGRAARGTGRTGLAIMLVEKSSYTLDPNAEKPEGQPATGRGRGRGKGRGARGGRGRGRGGRGANAGTAYAQSHGAERGSYPGDRDMPPVPPITPAAVPEDAQGEGLYQYIQACSCRRKMLNEIFANPENTPEPSVSCCDVCNPKLFDQTRPGAPTTQKRAKTVKKGVPVESVRVALETWRKEAKKTRYPTAKWTATTLLPDSVCEALASVGPITSKTMLEAVAKPLWVRWEELGEELFNYMAALDIPDLVARPAKRTIVEVEVSPRLRAQHSEADTSAGDVRASPLAEASAITAATRPDDRPAQRRRVTAPVASGTQHASTSYSNPVSVPYHPVQYAPYPPLYAPYSFPYNPQQPPGPGPGLQPSPIPYSEYYGGYQYPPGMYQQQTTYQLPQSQPLSSGNESLVSHPPFQQQYPHPYQSQSQVSNYVYWQQYGGQPHGGQWHVQPGERNGESSRQSRDGGRSE